MGLDVAMEQPPPAPPPPQAGEKKGMPALAWVGIGCGVIVVLLVVAVSLLIGKCRRWAEDVQRNPQKAAAEMVVRFNPDLDLVSQDEQAGQMTIRNNKTGEQVTLDYADIAEGRLTVVDGEGGVTEIGAGDDRAPGWVPRLPDAEQASYVFHNETADRVSGVMSIRTRSAAEEVAGYYESAAEEAGLGSAVTRSTSVGGTETRTLAFKGDGRTLNVQITVTSGRPVMVQVAYTEDKGP
jgi:hypothetical protein